MSKEKREAFVKGAIQEYVRANGPANTVPPWVSEDALLEALRRYPDKPLGNVREIVAVALKDNGYDGLYCEDCGCFLDDLFPCGGEWLVDCKPGYKCKCNDPEGGEEQIDGIGPGVLKDGKIVTKEARNEGDD